MAVTRLVYINACDLVLPERVLHGVLHLPRDLRLDEVLRQHDQPDYPAVVGENALQQGRPVFAVQRCS